MRGDIKKKTLPVCLENENNEAALLHTLSPMYHYTLPPSFFLFSPLSLQVHCVGQQGSLASVQSSDEYNFLQSMVILSGQSSAWIGGFYFQVRRSILI